MIDHIVRLGDGQSYCGVCARGVGPLSVPGTDGLMHRSFCYKSRPPLLASPLAAPEPSSTNKIAVAALWGLIAVGLGTMAYLIVKGPEENLARGVRRSPNVGRSPPIVKGRSTRFEMVEGPDVTCAGGMIHDPSGRAWPRNSVLCGPFRSRVRAATPEEYRGWAKDYLGSSHRPMVGVVDVPPRALSGWVYLGEVEKIYYTRIGKKRPGRYVHTFNKTSALATLVRGKGRVRLYRRGRFVRIDLPRGAQLDARGYVWP